MCVPLSGQVCIPQVFLTERFIEDIKLDLSLATLVKEFAKEWPAFEARLSTNFHFVDVSISMDLC